MTPRRNRYLSTTLTSDNANLKQRLFLLMQDREVFYGGAAGGAKTSGILAAALQYVDLPNYDALLLRENYKQLSQPGSWIPMAHEWLDRTDAKWNEGQKQWRFPSGATLTMGFVNPRMRDDVRKFQTGAYHFIGIDELTGWNEDDYRFLFSRLRRRSGSPIPPRMRSASNPGGRGHEWVKRRFVDAKTRRRTAIYLPALLTDNPYIDQDDYIESLREQHPTNWRRLLYGDWSVTDPGSMFQPRVWLDDGHFLDELPDPRSVAACVRYWDLAAAEPTSQNPDPDYTVGARISRLRDGLYVWEHTVRVRRTPAQTERIVRSTSASDHPRVRRQWVEQVAGAGKALVDHYKRNVFPDQVAAQGNPVQGSKALRARPLAAIMEKGRMQFMRAEWNDEVFDEMEAFSEDPQLSGAHDDIVDAGSGAFSKVMRRSAGAVVVSTPRGTVSR